MGYLTIICFNINWLNIPKENLDKYKTVSINFTLASNIKCISTKLSTNLILGNLFNPNRELFTISLLSPYCYLNREFRCSHLQLSDSYLDFVTFELNFNTEKNQILNLPSLEFKIELDLHEN